jgi:adenine/guanine phosphoribosyltransferase-like PRPP-binding protein
MSKRNDGLDLIVCERQEDASGCLLVRHNYLETLKRCKGFYECPCDSGGNFRGPLVGYAGTYEDIDGKTFHFVGAKYYNFSRADQWPAVLEIFAEAASEFLYDRDIEPTVILGVPMAGLKFSQEVAGYMECRHIFAEKRPVLELNSGARIVEELVLARYEIYPGDQVVIGEELVNNCSTTAKLIKLVEDAGGKVIGIVCAINRSYPFIDQYNGIPIVSVIEQPTCQYRQDEPEVVDLVKNGNVIWKPKIKDWPRLQKVMEDHGMF